MIMPWSCLEGAVLQARSRNAVLAAMAVLKNLFIIALLVGRICLVTYSMYRIKLNLH